MFLITLARFSSAGYSINSSAGTNKLRSYGVAPRELMAGVIHDNSQYANNRAGQSYQIFVLVYPRHIRFA